MGLGQRPQVHAGRTHGCVLRDPGADPAVGMESTWARTTQAFEYIKELPSNPAHLQPSPPWAKLADKWQNWTCSRGGDPGQKLGLPEALTLSLMGEGVAEKAAQPKALVTQFGSESASPEAEGEEEGESPSPAQTAAVPVEPEQGPSGQGGQGSRPSCCRDPLRGPPLPTPS